MPRIFKHLEAGYLQVNLMSTSAQINQLKHTILYYYSTASPIMLGSTMRRQSHLLRRQSLSTLTTCPLV